MDQPWEPPKTLRQIERELVADMDNARRDYERTCRELNSAPDTLMNRKARRQYAISLACAIAGSCKRFTDFVAHGKFPAASAPSRRPAPGSDAHAAEGGAS
jgi:hypothetical protein